MFRAAFHKRQNEELHRFRRNNCFYPTEIQGTATFIQCGESPDPKPLSHIELYIEPNKAGDETSNCWFFNLNI